MDLDAWLRNETATYCLELARVTGLVMIAPIPWVNAPKRVKAGLAMVLAFVAHGHAGVPDAIQTPVGMALGIGSELMIGGAMGLVVLFTIATVEVLGDTIGPAMGFGMAQVLDPTSHTQVSVITTLFRYFALLLALLVGAHRVMIAALLASFRAIPAGTLVDPGALFPRFLDLSNLVLVTGVRFALPVLAVLFMVQLALGFVSRAAPAMQIFSVGFAVTLAVGALVVLTALPDLGVLIVNETGRVGSRIESLLVELSP